MLDSHLISKFYKDFECPQILKYPKFNEILMNTATSYSGPVDVNEYCAGIERIKNYETIRFLYLKEQLSNSTLHWNVAVSNNYLVIWVPSPIPVKLDSIKCGEQDCTRS